MIFNITYTNIILQTNYIDSKTSNINREIKYVKVVKV